MKNDPIQGALKNTRMIGACLFIGVSCYAGWVLKESKREIGELEQKLGGWVGAQNLDTTTEIHMHDTYYVVANPGLITGGILALGVGFIALLFPRVLYLFAQNLKRKKDPNKAQMATPRKPSD